MQPPATAKKKLLPKSDEKMPAPLLSAPQPAPTAVAPAAVAPVPAAPADDQARRWKHCDRPKRRTARACRCRPCPGADCPSSRSGCSRSRGARRVTQRPPLRARTRRALWKRCDRPGAAGNPRPLRPAAPRARSCPDCGSPRRCCPRCGCLCRVSGRGFASGVREAEKQAPQNAGSKTLRRRVELRPPRKRKLDEPSGVA